MGRGLRYLTQADMPPHVLKLQRVAGDAMRDAQNPSWPRACELGKPKRRREQKEHNEQVVLFNRIAAQGMNDSRYAFPAKRTFAIPNGGARSKGEAGKLKAEGVKSGVSDIFCAYPVEGRHGLFLEMKSLQGARPKGEQRGWLEDSEELDYAAAWARGADAAMQIWLDYLAPLMEVA